MVTRFGVVLAAALATRELAQATLAEHPSTEQAEAGPEDSPTTALLLEGLPQVAQEATVSSQVALPARRALELAHEQARREAPALTRPMSGGDVEEEVAEVAPVLPTTARLLAATAALVASQVEAVELAELALPP